MKTPIKAIRANCYSCTGSTGWKDIELCQTTECPTHEYRLGKRPVGETLLTPGKSIDEYCLNCMGARVVAGKAVGRTVAAKRVRNCTLTHCELWHIRYGENKYARQAISWLESFCEPEVVETPNHARKNVKAAGSVL